MSEQDIFVKALDNSPRGLNGVNHIKDDFTAFPGTTPGLIMTVLSGRDLLQQKSQIQSQTLRSNSLVLYSSKYRIKPLISQLEAIQEMDPPINVLDVISWQSTHH